MASGIIAINGTVRAMYSNQPPWHRMGTIFDSEGNSAPNSKVAMQLSGLDYPIAKERVYIHGSEVPIPDVFATVRGDLPRNHPYAVLGTVGNRYRVHQNVECFQFLDSLAADGAILYESAMELYGGKQVALLARMPSVDTVADGDDQLRYLLMLNSHDGSSAITLCPTSVRVVCANTVRAALEKDGEKAVKILHTASKDAKLRLARQSLAKFDAQFESYINAARTLATRPIQTGHGIEYLRTVFPEPVNERGLVEHDSPTHRRWVAKMDQIRHGYKFGASNNLPSIRGTWWALFNSVTQHIDHETKFKGDDARDNKFEGLLVGKLADLKSDALRLAVTMA